MTKESRTIAERMAIIESQQAEIKERLREGAKSFEGIREDHRRGIAEMISKMELLRSKPLSVRDWAALVGILIAVGGAVVGVTSQIASMREKETAQCSH